MNNKLLAGSASIEITPEDSQFLFGYPHVERYSKGVHDPLYASALAISSGSEKLLIIANDIIFVSKQSTAKVRKRLTELTGIAEQNILISATHTHSGPLTMDYISNALDPTVPKADQNYVRFMEERIIEAGEKAAANLAPAEVGLAIADCTGVGTNRRKPDGPADPDVPVLAVRSTESGKMLALMMVCAMHPTVLHEDSMLISGDFPGMTRQYLQKALGEGCAVVYHTGCEGNQSPRHVTRENTFHEARRLGELLGESVLKALGSITYYDEAVLNAKRGFIELPGREFPSVEESELNLQLSVNRLEKLKAEKAASQEIRTAECDWFGAEETLTLSKAQDSGRVEDARLSCLPAEIQLLRIGPWFFAAWPGEMFIEYGLEIRRAFKNTFVINLANGELQGYIVTQEAALEGGYEASNALFSHRSGPMIVSETKRLLEESGVELDV